VAAFKEQRLGSLGQLFERLVDFDAQPLDRFRERVIHIRRTRARSESAVEQRLGGIDDDFDGVKTPGAAETIAGFARAEGAVKRERTGLELGNASAAIRT